LGCAHGTLNAYTWAGSGQYLGPAIGSVLAGWIVVRFGWEWSFILFGAGGLLILPFWIFFVRDRPEQDKRLTDEERETIGNRSTHTEREDWTASGPCSCHARVSGCC
jgi:MFS family permease